MIEIRDDKLVVNSHVIGDEDQIMTILEKAQKWDEYEEAIFKGRTPEQTIAQGEAHYEQFAYGLMEDL